MKLKLYQVDAFAGRVFEGNPAAVVPLEKWLPTEMMQLVAAENNLSETAFFVPTAGGFHIRWFTPTTEVDLCGHATLASAHVLFSELGVEEDVISFESRSGVLRVSKAGEMLAMDFPAQPPSSASIPDSIISAFGKTPLECLRREDHIVVYENESDVLDAQPDLNVLASLDLRGVMITAPSATYDFVVRFFAPKFGIPEDPVTGSAFTQLVPYWAAKMGTTKLRAKQLSERGGEVFCELNGDRVSISGNAVLYMTGEFILPFMP